MSFERPCQLWGEIPEKKKESTSSSSEAQPPQPTPTARLFQNSRTDTDKIKDSAFEENVSLLLCDATPHPKTTIVDPMFCAMEADVVNTIGLLKYTKFLEDMIEKYKLGTADLMQIKNIVSQPPIPRLDEKNLPKARKNSKQKDEKGVSYFKQGEWPPNEKPPPIPSRQILLKLLTKSVVTMLAFTGFDDTSASAVSVLTEVVDEYFSKFLSTLRDNCDAYYTPSQDIGFVDPMEATYQQMGIGSILNISDFYHAMIKGQQQKVKSKIIKLHEELRDLHSSIPNKFTFSSNIVHVGNVNYSGPLNSIKNETKDYQDIPTIHLPAQRSGDIINPVLAAGFEMLERVESFKMTTE